MIDLTTPLSPRLAQIADAVARLAAEAIESGGRVGVAYSGGVDSATLAALIARGIGRENTVLLLGISDSLAAREKRFATRQAVELGLELVEIATFEINDPAYRANDIDRCFHCKDELFTQIDTSAAPALGLAAVAYGENADDAARPDRPGQRAARDHGVLYPLSQAGATKLDVREIAAAFGLASAAKPAAPCLASRIPHGEEVTAEKLAAIDAAEDAVLEAGFSDCRVRHHGSIARIEVPADELSYFGDDDLRRSVLAGVKAAGFTHVTLDLAGIQSGLFTISMMRQ